MGYFSLCFFLSLDDDHINQYSIFNFFFVFRYNDKIIKNIGRSSISKPSLSFRLNIWGRNRNKTKEELKTWSNQNEILIKSRVFRFCLLIYLGFNVLLYSFFWCNVFLFYFLVSKSEKQEDKMKIMKKRKQRN